jgi:hypothetical protein
VKNRQQATAYTPGMKESFAWWTREFIDELRSEVKLPIEWSMGRTVIIFALASKQSRPRMGDTLYFELPAGIKIESLKTETHLFLFENPPADPLMALAMAQSAVACYTCTTTGAEDDQGNRELKVQWSIDGETPPVLNRVTGDIIRPKTVVGMQQVRAKVVALNVVPYEYSFEQEKKEWDPIYSDRETIVSASHALGNKTNDPDYRDASKGWILVKGLKPREPTFEGPEARALLLAVPDSGKLVLVSLRKRKKDEEDEE